MSRKFTEDEVKVVTRDVLDKLDIRSSLKGYVFISEMIWLKYQSRNDDPVKMMYLYSVCAKKYGSTSSRVERGIRHAISKISIDNPYYISILNETCDFTNSNILGIIYYYVIDILNGNKEFDISKSLIERVEKLEIKVIKLQRIINSHSDLGIMNERIGE